MKETKKGLIKNVVKSAALANLIATSGFSFELNKDQIDLITNDIVMEVSELESGRINRANGLCSNTGCGNNGVC